MNPCPLYGGCTRMRTGVSMDGQILPLERSDLKFASFAEWHWIHGRANFAFGAKRPKICVLCFSKGQLPFCPLKRTPKHGVLFLYILLS
ncbi:hypothetical protein Dip518_001598 [Parelusimicrobium proximum]